MNTATLGIEYRQWEFCMKLTQLFKEWLGCCLATKMNRKKDAVNVLQRWILSVQEEDFQRDSQTPLFPCIEEEHFINRKLAEDIHRKGFVQSMGQSWDIVRNLLSTISDWRTDCYLNIDLENPEVNTELHENDKTKIIVGNFTSPPIERITFLIQHFDKIVTATMLLRYESLGNGSYQWGDPLKVHRAIYSLYGARYEGFASPLNSRFITMEGARFCSLFPDTDSVFGSLGNFFKLDLMEHQGGWTVNPPFIEHVMERVSRRVLSYLENGIGSYFFITYPYWDDSSGWILLDESEFKTAREDFFPKEFTVQDAYGTILKPINKLSMFIMGTLPDTSPTPKKLYQIVARRSF